MKRIYFLLALACFSLVTFAEGPDFQDGNLYYKLIENKECYVYGLVNEGPTKLVIPSTAQINGRTFPVTGICGWSTWTNMYPGVTKIILPESVKFVGAYAFWSNTLESVQMDGVEELGFRAFGECNNLKTISNKKIQYIGDNAFEGCKSLQKLVIPSSCLEVGANVIPTNSGDEFTLIIEDSDKPLIFCSDFYGCHGKRIYIGRNLNCAKYWVNRMRSEKYGTMYLGDLYYFKEVDFGDKVTLMPSIYKKRSRYKSYEEFKHLTIGSSVVEVPDFSDEDNDIQSIHMVSMTPPAVNGKFNSRTYIYGKLYVPKGSLSAYKNAPVWKEFFSIEEYESPRTAAVLQQKYEQEVKIAEERRIAQEKANREARTKRGNIGNNLKWELYEGTLTIIGKGEMIDIEPKDAPWKQYKDSIRYIKISDNITNIGDYAFCKCRKLTSITIPKSVIYIGDNAFEECVSLSSINIPNNVTSIGKEVFRGCNNLASVMIPNSVINIGSYAFSRCEKLSSITLPNSINTIGKGTFHDCESLASITIPNSVTSIGEKAFYGCKKLSSIILPDNITSIKFDTFSDCVNLTSITIPNSVTNIGVHAFSGCKNLTSIILSNNIKTIESGAFQKCENLSSFTIPNSLTSIAANAFWGTKLETPLYNSYSFLFLPKSFSGEYAIPDGIEFIAKEAFSRCFGLTNITIPESVTNIGDKAFYECSGLTSVTIPVSVTSIGCAAFAYCKNLKTITIPSSVTSIHRDAFVGCSELSITLPKIFKDKVDLSSCKKVKYKNK